MDTRSLTLFLNLSETLHFGRTSEELHISPSALSRSIKQLEENLGVTLFERDNRRVALTQEGKLLQTYARDTLQQWDAFRDSLMEESHDLKGEISIYCSVTASYSFLYDILSDFRQRHPRIELKLHTGDPAPAISRVLNGQEDIAIAARPDKLPDNLAFRRIAVSPLVFIAPKEVSDNLPVIAPASADDWANTPMILSEEGIARERIDGWFKRIKVTPRIYAQVAGHEALVSMVSLGFGIGVVPQIVLENSPLADRVEILPQLNELGHYDVGLCTLKKRLKSPIIAAFWGS
ncbi:HTH-type transcriptional activator IlvY [Aestuariicella sp. G3-2]|uniref:HTH-type transcriptional activator IlvY n=1 Tax=Pseudomaricurvus albidus TaxID=2842452 RepID=UPI001C0BF69C|nr:HTH-type transcriptional activator IlvY [Aestuariicella albida]MBU3071511.1 HTH-type transcriptional activator IlvY [Aestuariicella albida]